MKIGFKQAEKQDVSVLWALAEKIWKAYYPDIITREQIDYMLNKMYSPDALLKQMEEGHRFTIAYADEKPVAYASVSLKSDGRYMLHKFYVDTALHRTGLGSGLFDYVISQLPLCKDVELTVNRKNYKAINFYFKKGFVIERVADFDIGNGFFMNDFVMLREG